MKKGLIIGVIIAVVIIAVIVGVLLNKSYSSPQTNNPSSSNPPSNSLNVDISNFQFSPSTITIKTGQTVTWTNKDSTQHTITSDSGSELASAILSPGQTYSHTFDSSGTYSYHCSFHPGMKAKVIVQ